MRTSVQRTILVPGLDSQDMSSPEYFVRFLICCATFSCDDLSTPALATPLALALMVPLYEYVAPAPFSTYGGGFIFIVRIEQRRAIPSSVTILTVYRTVLLLLLSAHRNDK
jgi:hypothetical protein